MPIDNAVFVPPVVCNQYHNRQIAEWLAGRPVPTMAEMGVKPPTISIKPGSGDGTSIRVSMPYSNPAPQEVSFPRSIPAEFVDEELLTHPPREAIPVRPVNDPSVIPVAIKRPPAIIGAPTRILPPPKKRA